MTDPTMTPPNYVNTGTSDEWDAELSNLKDQLSALLKKNKPELAIMFIMMKLMPFMQNYNLEYRQGNASNQQAAASYVLKQENAIEEDYRKSGDSDVSDADKTKAVTDAQARFKALQEEVHGKNGKIYGSMVNSVDTDLKNAMTPPTGTSLKKYWEDSWTSMAGKSGGTGGSPDGPDKPNGNANSEIMSNFNNAQTGAQSRAAFVQTQLKLFTQYASQFMSQQENFGQGMIDVEKQAVRAGSAG